MGLIEWDVLFGNNRFNFTIVSIFIKIQDTEMKVLLC